MPDFDFLATLGVGGVLAGVMFMFYRKDVRQFTELWKVQSEMLMVVVKENTSSNVTLVEMVRSLHKRLDQDNRRADERESRADERSRRGA